MKHAISFSIPFAVVTSATIAACFGAGPTPGNPSDATIVFGVDPTLTNGCVGHYIGDVAFDADHGYAVTLPYVPTNCGGGTPPQEPQGVYEFATAGGSATMIGNAGSSPSAMTNAQPPRVIATPRGPRWEYLAAATNVGSGSSPMVVVDSVGGVTLMLTSTNIGGTFGPQGLVTDGTTLYVATSELFHGSLDSNDPDYLCCTNSSMTSGQADSAEVRRFDPSGSGSGSGDGAFVVPAGTTIDCQGANRCYAASGGSLFWFNTKQIMTVATSGGSVATFSTLAPGSNLSSPVGIAASPTKIAWAASINYLTPTSMPPQGCQITVADPATPSSATAILTTSRFSCMDVAIDDTYAYFAIVSVTQNGDTNGGGNPPLVVHGDGVGRVPLAGGQLESLALGFVATKGGPRRIYLDATSLYAVDPQVIGKIAKTALDGRHDFTP
jgi:hypothetical protein